MSESLSKMGNTFFYFPRKHLYEEDYILTMHMISKVILKHEKKLSIAVSK